MSINLSIMPYACNKISRYILLFLLYSCFILKVSAAGISADTINIPDSLMNHDAVMILNENITSYKINNLYNYPEKEQHIRRKIKIFTEKGADECSKIIIPVNWLTKINDFRIKIYRPSGDSVAVKMDFLNQITPDGEKEQRMTIPDLRVGDLLYVDISVKNPAGFYAPNEIFLYEDIPVINSVLTLKFANLSCKLKTYNGFPEPIRSYDRPDSIYTWHCSSLKAVPREDNAIFYNEMPFVRYMLINVKKQKVFADPIIVPNQSWAKNFQTLNEAFEKTPKQKKADYFDEFLSEKLKNCDSCDKLEQFKMIYQFVQDSIEITYLQKKTNYCSGYYLYTRKINRFRQFALYIDLFRHFHFPYYYVFVRDKFTGEFDDSFVSSDMYDQLYLAFKDEKMNMHYLTSTGSKIGLDQINSRFQGTHALIYDPQKPLSFERIVLPQWKSEDNLNQTSGFIKIDPDMNSLSMNLIHHYTGVEAIYNAGRYSVRSGSDSAYILLEKDLKSTFSNLEITESTLGTKSYFFPYNYEYSFKSKRSNIITAVDENLFSFPVSSLVEHEGIATEENKRTLDFYILYPFRNQFNYNIVFPEPVELLNSDKLQSDYANGYGSYNFSVKQVNDTVLTIYSGYVIKSDFIPASDYSMLREINEQWKRFKDASILIRKKVKPENL